MTSIAQVLNETAQWPVGHVSAAAINGGGASAFAGDIHRVYELASVTKLLAGYAALVAVEEEAISLSDEVAPGVSIRHLLAHASGMSFATPTFERAPETKRIYSSAGIEAVAQAIEQNTEMPFGTYAAEAVFQPLGMTATEIYGPAGHAGRSTVADLTAFAKELLAPKLLHPSTLAEAMTVQFAGLDGIVPGYGNQRPNDWGLAFEIKGTKGTDQGTAGGHWTGRNQPADTVGHFGQSGTFLWVHPATGRAAVALTDTAFGPWAKPLWQEFNDRLWQAMVHASGD